MTTPVQRTQPTTTVIGGRTVTLGYRSVLKVVALVLFIIATIVALGDASFKWDAALLPAGLAFWVGSEV